MAAFVSRFSMSLNAQELQMLHSDCELMEHQLLVESRLHEMSKLHQHQHQHQQQYRQHYQQQDLLTSSGGSPNSSITNSSEQEESRQHSNRRPASSKGFPKAKKVKLNDLNHKQAQVTQSQQSELINGLIVGGDLTRVNYDPVYLEDDEVFFNLILKEAAELERRQLLMIDKLSLPPLADPLRHSLLSWMLKCCELQLCQDEIFPLASMILDKFLLFYPIQIGHPISSKTMTPKKQHHQQQQQPPQQQSIGVPNSQSHNDELHANERDNDNDEDEHNLDAFHCNEDEDELNQRQLYLFAACSLLLASKLRQTPRLCIQALVEFSHEELPVALSRDEILDGERLILTTLKWDIAALVTPNDFLTLLWGKCNDLLLAVSQNSTLDDLRQSSIWSQQNSTNDDEDNHNNSNQNGTQNSQANRCDESRVKRHTQALLELCLMDSQLSQYSPSVLAMASMAVAIYGLNLREKEFCWQLDDIVEKIHESTHKVNEPELMIDVAYKIEKYVQKLLNSTHDD